ncbi:hypothetical protein D3C72_1558820 [compost metagenome]
MAVVGAGDHHLILFQDTEHFAAATNGTNWQTPADHFAQHGQIGFDFVFALQAVVGCSQCDGFVHDQQNAQFFGQCS